MLMRIAGIVPESIVDGPGFRLTVFVQGCPHGCEGCHNPETHDFAAGTIIDTDEIVSMMRNNPLLDGITLSGGEPFCQSEACRELAQAAKYYGLNVWVYTGFTLREILQRGSGERLFLNYVDVLVDGPYIQNLRTLDAPWRGSKNQRLIDVRKTISAARIVEWKG